MTGIPRRADDVDGLVTEARRQADVVAGLFVDTPGAALLWRPAPERWSITGHVAHLCITNAAYLDAIGRAVEGARARGGPTGKGPYRHPRIATWFVGQLEPPPKRRVKTFRSMEPPADPAPAEVAARFAGFQDDLVERMAEARALDLGRIRFGSPFFAPLRFSLGTAFALLLSHNRRHLWLIDEVVAHDAFPSRPTER